MSASIGRVERSRREKRLVLLLMMSILAVTLAACSPSDFFKALSGTAGTAPTLTSTPSGTPLSPTSTIPGVTPSTTPTVAPTAAPAVLPRPAVATPNGYSTAGNARYTEILALIDRKRTEREAAEAELTRLSTDRAATVELINAQRTKINTLAAEITALRYEIDTLQ